MKLLEKLNDYGQSNVGVVVLATVGFLVFLCVSLAENYWAWSLWVLLRDHWSSLAVIKRIFYPIFLLFLGFYGFVTTCMVLFVYPFGVYPIVMGVIRKNKKK